MAADTQPATPATTQTQIVDRLSRLPYWLILILLGGVILFYSITTDELYSVIFGRLAQGVAISLFVAIASYVVAIVIGLIVRWGGCLKTRSRIIWRPCTLTSFAACRFWCRFFTWPLC